MKKLLTILLFLSTAIAHSYTPTQGPLTFVDTPTQRGAIYLTSYNNPHLVAEYNTLSQFARTLPPASQTYQGIMDGIINSQTPLAIQTLEALENILMYMYHDKALSLEIPYLPKFLGIRQSWLKPAAYINPKSWIKDNHPELDQIINELKQLAQIATSKNYSMGARMHAKVHAYRHWRIYCYIIAYLMYDRSQRTWKESFIYRLWNDDDFEGIRKNLCKDTSDLGQYLYKQTDSMYQSFKNYWLRTHKEKNNVKNVNTGLLNKEKNKNGTWLDLGFLKIKQS